MDLLNELMFSLGNSIIFFLLFREQFKYNSSVIISVLCSVTAINIYVHNFSAGGIVILLAVEIVERIFKIFIYKDNLRNCYSLDYISMCIVSLIGNASVTFTGIIVSLLSNANTISWPNVQEMSSMGFVLINAAMCLGWFIAFKLAMIVKTQILALKGFLSNLLFFLLPLPSVIIGILKNTFMYEYDIEPSGIIMIIEMITMSVAIITFAIVIIVNVRKIKKHNKEMFEELENHNAKLTEYYDMQESLSELHHDIKNYIVSEKKDKDYIANYCNEFLEKTEDKELMK